MIRVVTTRFSLDTKGDPDIIDITDKVQAIVDESSLVEGSVTVFVGGSTGGITTIEYEPGVIADLRKAIERIVPRGIHYDHDARWGDGNGFSHVRAAIIGPSLHIPFEARRLLLGTWQQIVFCDFDNRPRSRKIAVQVIGVSAQ